MRRLLVLMTALLITAFALPAFAQPPGAPEAPQGAVENA